MNIGKLYKVTVNIIIKEPREILVAGDDIEAVQKYLKSTDEWTYDGGLDGHDTEMEVAKIEEVETIEDFPYEPDGLAWNDDFERPLGAFFYWNELEELNQEHEKAWETQNDDLIQKAANNYFEKEEEVNKRFLKNWNQFHRAKLRY